MERDIKEGMQKMPDDEIIKKKPFSLLEAVILLDVYLTYVRKGKTIAYASEIASQRLRAMAVRNGFQIDASFRSAQGIVGRLRNLDAVYEGKTSKSAPGSRVFADAVDLYRNNSERFYAILMTEYNNTADNIYDEEAGDLIMAGRKLDTALTRTKFVRCQRDQGLKDKYPETMRQVYYSLKRLTEKEESGVTPTDIFLDLQKNYYRKQIAEILEKASWSKQKSTGHYVFIDRDLEEKRMLQMEEKQKADEKAFFKWLPSVVSPPVLQEIQKSYGQINALLIKRKILSKNLTNVTQISQIEEAIRQVKKSFGSKRLRSTAVSLLTAYLAYLREVKHTVPVDKYKPEVEVQDNWIRFDFTNSREFKGTVPAYCSVKERQITGVNWTRILVGLIEHEIQEENPTLRPLYKTPLLSTRKSQPFFMKEKIDGLHCAQLSNGYWINVNHNTPKMMDIIQAFCIYCGYKKEQIWIYGVAREESLNTRGDSKKPTRTKSDIPIEKAEEYLLGVGMNGSTVQDLIAAVQPEATVTNTRSALDQSMNVMSLPGGRYVHVESFIDLDEAEEILGRILKTHFRQLGGYSNSQLLYDAAEQELSMFLNDNDCEDADTVYAIARYFFEKKAEEGQKCRFVSPHIFESKPDYPETSFGLMINLARGNDGILLYSDAEAFLKKTKLAYPGIGSLLQIGKSNTFLMVESDRFVLSECIGIDEAWCGKVHDCLEELFRQADVSYIIPRDIRNEWLMSLPTLPSDLSWTRLLLQEVIKKYPAIGFRTISPELNQTFDTLVPAIVPADSPLNDFPDVVSLYMRENYTLPMRLDKEKLRNILGEAGMLEGGEMIGSLHKALHDYRFAWSDENRTVYVQ